MDDITKAAGTLALLGALIFFAPIVGTALGAFAGLCVGVFFDDTLRAIQVQAFAIREPLQPWQLGAGLGFVAGFLRRPEKKAS